MLFILSYFKLINYICKIRKYQLKDGKKSYFKARNNRGCKKNI